MSSIGDLGRENPLQMGWPKETVEVYEVEVQLLSSVWNPSVTH